MQRLPAAAARGRPHPHHGPRAAALVSARRLQHQDSHSGSRDVVPVASESDEGHGHGQQQQRKRRKGGAGLGTHQRVAWRKYLSHPGVPGGTPSEREQMAAKLRMAETAQRVQKHRLGRFGERDEDLAETGEEGNKTVRGAASIVEERIQLSMIRGEFENLPNKGKPLERERTPGLDRTTDIFMDILQRNGVVPEWIQRQKRVAAMTSLLRRRLEVELAVALMDLHPELEHAPPEQQAAALSLGRRVSPEAFAARVHGIASIREDLAVINSEIDTYNLQVPALHLQRLRLRLEPLVAEAMHSPPATYREAYLAYRAATREGLLGCTCLMEHRLDHFGEDEDGSHYYVAGGGAHVTTYWQEEGGSRRRKRRDAASDHIAELLMIPIDGLSRFLSRIFSI